MIVDLVGKGGHIRTVPVPAWVKSSIDCWMTASKIRSGRLFRCVNKTAPHDLRRTCARLCHEAGGELEQIQFLLGHVSVQTTEHYLGCKQRLRVAVNDKIGLEPMPT